MIDDIKITLQLCFLLIIIFDDINLQMSHDNPVLENILFELLLRVFML